MDKNWIVGLYIRLSVEDGDKAESNSITNQKMVLSGFLSEHKDFQLYDYYIDDGFSGTDFNRPGWQRLMKDVKDGKLNTIIVKDLSRLGRNYIESGKYIEESFPLLGIRFIAINDNIDSYERPDSVDSIIVPFKNLINDAYCRDISNKIRAVFRTKARNGIFTGAFAPYGYKKDPNQKGHLIIDPDTEKNVKLIFDLALKGNSLNGITHKINEIGIPSPSAYKIKIQKSKYQNPQINDTSILWNCSSITKVLKNRVYCGDLVSHKQSIISYKNHHQIKVPEEEWIIVENTHEPIIDRETFNQIQDVLFSRDNRSTKEGKLVKFSGHIRCSTCGRPMTKRYSNCKSKDGERYFYYLCSTYLRKSKKACTIHSIGREVLDDLVLKAIRVQVALAFDFDKAIKKICSTKKVDYKEDVLKSNLSNFKKELSNQTKLKMDCYSDWKNNIISEDDYKLFVSNYTCTITELEKKINDLEDQIKKYDKNNINNNIWIDNFKKYKDIKVLTREIVCNLIDYVIVDDNQNITIKFNFEDEYKNAYEFIKNNS